VSLERAVGGACSGKNNTRAMLELLKFFDWNCKTPQNATPTNKRPRWGQTCL